MALGVRFWMFFDRSPPELTNIISDTYIGVIDDDPEDKSLSQVFPVRISPTVRIRVYVPRYPRYAYGDQIEITGKLSVPRSFSSGDGKVFDYENYLAKDDIYFEVKNPSIRIVAHEKGNWVVSLLLKIKHAFLSNLKSVLGEPHASLAGGLVVGEKSALGKDLIDDFRRAGLIHIVVLSGFNITIVAAAIRRMLVFLPRKIGIVVGGFAMILFCVLVGGGATVIRSCLMGMIGLIAEFTRREYRVGRALGIAGYLMLMQNPAILLYDPSFQLSFLATLALILLATPIEERLTKFGIPELFGIRGLVATTLATQVFVSPFIFYLMGQVSMIGVIVNILVLPAIPITMLLVTMIGLGGFSVFVLGDTVGHVLMLVAAFPTHMLLSYELWIVRFAAHMPFAVFSLHSFSITAMWATYGVYLAVYVYRRLHSHREPPFEEKAVVS